jgi:predicted ArsR family transcriptional regulator
MSDDDLPPLREAEQLVLQCIRNGYTDAFEAGQELTLSNSQIRHAFRTLAEKGYIDLHREDGYVERTDRQGQTRVFKAPYEAELTDKAGRYVQQQDAAADLDQYRQLSHDELVQTVHDLEQRVDRLEQGFEAFRRQVQQHITDQ